VSRGREGLALRRDARDTDGFSTAGAPGDEICPRLTERGINISSMAYLAMNKALLIVALLFVGSLPVSGQTNSQKPSLTYGLVIDCSGSVRQNLKYIAASASLIVDSNTASDKAFITRFISSDKIKTAQELTSDKLAQDSGGKVVFAEQGKYLPTKAPDLIHLLREGNVNRTTQPNKKDSGRISVIKSLGVRIYSPLFSSR